LADIIIIGFALCILALIFLQSNGKTQLLLFTRLGQAKKNKNINKIPKNQIPNEVFVETSVASKRPLMLTALISPFLINKYLIIYKQ